MRVSSPGGWIRAKPPLPLGEGWGGGRREPGPACSTWNTSGPEHSDQEANDRHPSPPRSTWNTVNQRRPDLRPSTPYAEGLPPRYPDTFHVEHLRTGTAPAVSPRPPPLPCQNLTTTSGMFHVEQPRTRKAPPRRADRCARFRAFHVEHLRADAPGQGPECQTPEPGTFHVKHRPTGEPLRGRGSTPEASRPA